MAEVLAPIPQMLHAQDAFQPSAQAGISAHRSSQAPRGVVYPQNGYRAGSSAPISPYAFQSTPPLRQGRHQHPVSTYKAVPSRPGATFRPPYQDSSASSVSSTSSSSNRSVPGNHGSIDDSVLAIKNRQTLRDNRVSSNIAASLSTPDLSLPAQEVAKASPNRYHRLSQRFDNPPAKAANEAARPVQPVAAPPAQLERPTVDRNSIVVSRPPIGGRTGSFDDAMSPAPNSARYKRRSFINRVDSSQPIAQAAPVMAPTWSQVVTGKYSQNGPLPPPQNPFARPQHARSSSLGESQPKLAPRPVPVRHSTYNPSPRPTSFYIESPKRQVFDPRPMTAPSPVRPKSSTGPPGLAIKAEKPRPATAISSAEVAVAPKIEAFKQPRSVSASAAATQLAALNEKGSSRNLKSRLRRAFSFSGSTELRKASAENNLAAERAKMRKDAEQAEEDATVAATQEANGLGSNIYSGQAEFIASTDNISISSTASSASVMLRKFGRGMKKSTRNLRNLFRPKSMIVTGSEGLEETLAAEVSLVTVEAERLKVNVNLDPHDKPGGGTGYPKLERNSIEVPDGMAPEFESPRKSIIGGDRERAEVLAAVRKGILKRSGPPSAASSPSIAQGELPIQGATFFGGESSSSLPSPVVGRPSSDSGAVTSDEYFGGIAANPAGSTRSLPTAAMRSVSFGTRVQFFDVWSSSEYDRRGDVVTCNCLTPLLAQQIKEELNTFKMEMEVHEESKPHTHFF